eukprot:g9422.t1
MFGVSSDKSEAAKTLLYPHPSATDMAEESRRCGPGEQRRRGYSWDVDIENHRFGRPGSLESPLSLDNGSEPPKRIVSKKLEDFRETQDTIGRAKNLGHDPRDHLGKHVYGKEAVDRGPNEWDARACVEGDYSWAEQQPDNDLGKSITPGFRNAIADGRAFGVPTIRSDIQPYAQRSVADTQNYGDDSSARYLVNPSQFSQFGIADDEFFMNRGQTELRSLFESIGYSFSPEAAPPAPPGAAAARPGSHADAQSRSSRWLTVNDAMDYLDAVKLEFRDQPEIYDEFLAIMGRFKTKQMLPPDVIVEVARLFRGRNSLVLRFNRFLPEGYKIGLDDIERMEEEYQAKQQNARSGQATGDGDRSVLSVQSGEDSDPEDRAMEFDHAIHYVTTIKRRFAEDIGTYKAFLEILHTYQREQQDTHSGINHVLEQITDLFADEPDLLREFTYFLPDTVQAQAKERLDRAAVEAEVRLGRSQNGQRLQRLPAHKSQGGPQRGQAQGKLAGSSRDMQRGNRGQQRPGPRGGGGSGYRNDDDADQEWREQRMYSRGRGGTTRRGYQGGYGPPSQYSNGGMGGDPDRHPSRNPYYQAQRRRGAQGRQTWSRAEEYDAGPDGVFKGPHKRSREHDDAGPAGRGWPSADSHGTTIKPSPANQLFDQAREVLSSSGDDTDWTEFLKCLDLFSNEILGRDELLDMVHDLFEAHDGFDLMDDFKDLVHRRGTLEPPARDAMPPQGLSEINFENTKMCTPSYREWPKEHQGVSCSGRSAGEDTVLNDLWVSVPVGSEDNNFKHMRRNANEEQLFKIEDERFELDMLIDGVAAAIARLEPLEEEIEALRATVGSASGRTSETSAETSGEGATAAWPDGGDPSLPQFQYRLDRRTLGPLHLSTVSRLYGDHGPEVVDLLRKNPAMAVPVVLKRLRQKEKEWCAAREEAKSSWKEMVHKNFHKSLDHRSHQFRREDKRQTSNRVLLQQIKERKVQEDPQQAAMVKTVREKVPESTQSDGLALGRVSPTSTAADVDSVSAQGSAGEADTSALDGSAAGATNSPDTLVVKSDDASTTGSQPGSKERARVLREQAEQNPPWYMFAHLTLPYPTEGTAAIHKDIMELLTHTLARRPPSEDDVRQASRVVAYLLPAFFALGSSKEAANGEGGKASDGGSAQVVTTLPVLSSDDDSSDDEKSQSSGDEPKGDGRASPPSVSDGGPGPNSDSQGGVPAKDAGSGSAEDTQDRVETAPLPQGQEVFFTTTDFYLVLRLHHVLAERLAEAKKLCREAGLSRQTVVASPEEVLRASAGVTGSRTQPIAGDKEETGYRTFLGHLFDLLEEKINTDRYEESVRQLVGNRGYVLCNVDKLVLGLLQNLYRAGADKVFHKLSQLYYYERTTQSDGVSPAIYRRHVQDLLCRSEKEVVRVQYHPGAHKASGGWQVEPELKMEFIGRMGTEEKEEKEKEKEKAAVEMESTNDGSAQKDSTEGG